MSTTRGTTINPGGRKMSDTTKWLIGNLIAVIVGAVAILAFGFTQFNRQDDNRQDDNRQATENRVDGKVELLRSDTSRQFESVNAKFDKQAADLSDIKAALARLEERAGTRPKNEPQATPPSKQ